MNARVPPDRQQVFINYRELFTGKNAAVRKTKAIRKIILSHSPASEVSAADPDLDNSIHILRSLLTDRVFECEVQARKHFPGLFPAPSTRRPTGRISKKRKASNLHSGEQVRSVRAGRTDRLSPGPTDGMRCSILLSGTQCLTSIRAEVDRQQKRSSWAVVQPLKFPIDVQHWILSFSQQILEASCFKFMYKWDPSLLQERGWNCGAAVELTKWLHIIKQHLNNLPKECLSTTGQASFGELSSIVTTPCCSTSPAPDIRPVAEAGVLFTYASRGFAGCWS
jgi:hypothetical protein